MKNDIAIKEINKHISDALEQWSTTMLVADADEWSERLEYSNNDALNVIFMFNHVLMNIGIKNGTLNEENAVRKSLQLRDFVKDYCGLDTVEITRESLCLNKKDYGNKS